MARANRAVPSVRGEPNSSDATRGGESAGRGGDGPGVEDCRTAEDRRADELLRSDDGLSEEDAATRLASYGPNAIEEEERGLLRELASHFWGPIPWMIEVAVILTAVTARWADFGIIIALLILNGGVGFWEEHQAAGAIEALRKRLARRARVQRDGAWRTVPAEQVVPGDLLSAERGDVVPADGRLVSGSAETDESTLTGESMPVAKATGDSLYSGTVITRGAPRARVLATGSRTQFGRTAELTTEKGPPSHFQRAIFSIGRYLIMIAIGLVGVIVAVSLMRGTDLAATLEFALVVTIASIPVALPAVLSVTMAVGARDLARHEAVVSHLPAVEEMSGVDVLCADKTGTITKNELELVDVGVIAEGFDRATVLRAAALTVERDGRDPVDMAIIRAAGEASPGGVEVREIEPFDASRKRAEALVRNPEGRDFRVAKGAVQAILRLTGDEDDAAERLTGLAARFAERGYRSLAVASTESGGWRVLGVLAIQDPPRDDSAATLRQARELGVEVKMLTGDRAEIGREVALEVGMGEEVLDSAAIEGLEGEALAGAVESADGFAQVVPEDKFRIVEALQKRDHIVGMTGDGVNDAPALSRADVGIAVAGATDAARAASDIVLISPGLSVIVEAIHRAREVFRRMTNYAIYRITETIRIVLFATAVIVALDFFPVAPTQIVLLAILNDAAILTIAYDRVRPSARPERWDLNEVLSMATLLGLVGVVSSFGIVWIGSAVLDLADADVRTLVYLKLSVAGHLTLFAVRTRGPFWTRPMPARIMLVAVIGTQILATVIAVTGFLMEPLEWSHAVIVWGYALIWFLLLDRAKLLAYRVLDGRAAQATP